MRLINRIWVLLPMFLTCLSCQDDILNKKPLDIISDDVVWNDQALMDAFLANLYRATPVLVQDCSGLANGWGTDPLSETTSWDREFWASPHGTGFLTLNQLSDEAKQGWEGSGDTWKLNGISVDGGLMEYWNAPYKVIRNLNMFIEQANNSPLDKDFLTKRVGEARFLRAFNYFAMVKRYGGVPIITKVLAMDSPEEELYPCRNSEKEVYDFIISEMEDVKENYLPETTDVGRPSKWAALALQCRAALYAGSIAQFGKVQLEGLLGIPSDQAAHYYQIAYDAAMEIKDFGPYALFEKYEDKVENFRQLFIEKNHSEAIFVVQHDGLDAIQSTGNGWSWDFTQCPRPHSWNCGNSDAPYLEMIDEFENIDGTSGKMDRDLIQQGEWTLEELWGKKEPRFAATIWTQGTPWKGAVVGFCPGESQNIVANDLAGKTGFGVLKYTDEEANNMEWFCRSKTDYMTFRYGEVLLNLAEAAFELNKPDEALSAVNEIRSRAGVKTLESIDREKIRHERKIELAYEGHRYWDLRRWRIAVDVLNDKNYSGIKYDFGEQEGKYKITILENIYGTNRTVFQEKNYYFPITKSRRASNPNLVENPGY